MFRTIDELTRSLQNEWSLGKEPLNQQIVEQTPVKQSFSIRLIPFHLIVRNTVDSAYYNQLLRIPPPIIGIQCSDRFLSSWKHQNCLVTTSQLQRSGMMSYYQPVHLATRSTVQHVPTSTWPSRRCRLSAGLDNGFEACQDTSWLELPQLSGVKTDRRTPKQERIDGSDLVLLSLWVARLESDSMTKLSRS